VCTALWAIRMLTLATGLQEARLPGSISCMGLVGYGSYDTESHKPRGTEIFDEYFETLYPEGALEYKESDATGGRAELRVDEEGYWWVRYMSPFGDRISEVHDDENSAWESYRELVQRVVD
jgi:hypothetical protein